MKKEGVLRSRFHNKKGLSTIVISLILVLLSLVAIGVVWFVVSGIISDASGDVGLERLTISLDITNAYEYNGDIITTLKRNVGIGQIVGLTFVLYDNSGETESYTSENSINELESKKFTIPVSEFNSTEIDKIAVAPIYLSSGSEEKLGDILDTFTITKSYTGSTPPDGSTSDTTNTGDTNDTTNTGDTNDTQETCTPESDAITCSGAVCGTKTNNCGTIVSCGTCESGLVCEEGACTTIQSVNSGTVEDLWPGDSGMYFGSSSLPTDTSYVGYYAKFPGSAENSCLLIVLYRYPTEGYDKSHVGFSFSTSLQIGDSYEIYSTIEGCSA